MVHLAAALRRASGRAQATVTSSLEWMPALASGPSAKQDGGTRKNLVSGDGGSQEKCLRDRLNEALIHEHGARRGDDVRLAGASSDPAPAFDEE